MTKHKNLCYRYSCNKFEFITIGICESYASNKSFDLLIDSEKKVMFLSPQIIHLNGK